MWRLKSCPKCRGDLVLGNKDKHGWYEQCLQCGYIHDLEQFPIIKNEDTEDEKESIVAHYISAKGSRAVFWDTARLKEGYHKTVLSYPTEFRLILDALHKRHQENRQTDQHG